MAKKNRFLRNLRRVTEPLVIAAEMLFGEGNGESKKQWVIASLNDRFDFPLLNERQEAWVIGLVIDLMVDILNEQGKLEQIAARSAD